ncbi:hypothetical protein MAP00_003661 [Monascus purpureus]|nr:hypothetical protein MAP00_003661 [Monascus purpureus]
MPNKIIFLTGAPMLQSLRWDEDELLDKPVPPFYTEEDAREQKKPPLAFPGSLRVKWRLLQGQTAPEQSWDYPPGYSQDTPLFTMKDPAANDMSLVTSTQKTNDSGLSQFYDHSFAIHESSTILNSQPLRGDSFRASRSWADNTGIDSSGISIETDSDEGTSCSSLLSMQGLISDLEEIPSAGYLRSIVPQTMTVNFIVGVLAVHPPRHVVTRQWKRELTIVELVVGDETKTGFGVTFWLPSANGDDDGLGKTLSALRPRDIILLRTVALSSFRERVYGQSLRKGTTKVDLLHRQPVDSTDAVGIYGLRAINNDIATKDDLLLAKVRKVREWILRFVGYPADRVHRQADQMLPPDTQ